MSTTHFISGHLDLSNEEFNKYYKTNIDNAIINKESFVIGDAKGADSIAQQYLAMNVTNYDSTLLERVTIYHMCDKPRNNYGNFKTNGGFTNDDERDSQMTKDSGNDILWIRSLEEQKKRLGSKFNPNHINGTTKNLIRRQKIK